MTVTFTVYALSMPLQCTYPSTCNMG